MISIIVTVYDQALSGGWLLSALKEQQCRDRFEVLVCDDGSSCDMVGVVREAARNGALDLRYIWQPHTGFRAGRSRNNGIRAAQGDLLVFLDGDMLVDEDFVARHAAAHARPRRLVVGPLKRIPECPISDRASTLEYARGYRKADAFLDSQATWVGSKYSWMSCLSGNMSVPRGPEIRFDERFVGWGGEDRELAYRLSARHAYEVVYEPSAITYHPGTTTGERVMSDSSRIAAYLRNRLHFRSLYPDADLSPVFDSIRRLALDPVTDTWRVGPIVRSPDAVLREAEQWLHTHDVAAET